MPIRNTPERWGALAKFFHWTLALLILGLFFFGLYIADVLKGFDKIAPTNLHKSLGLIVLFLALARIFWRFAGGAAPKLPLHMPFWEKGAAHLGHLALYVLMILMPLSGWWSVSASPLTTPVKIFDWLTLPHLTTPQAAAQLAQSLGLIGAELTGSRLMNASWNLWKEVHGAIAWGLVLVVAGHALAALKHHFVNRDGVLRRMLPFGGPVPQKD